MATYALTITVYENGQEYPVTGYSGPELTALTEVIEELWSPTYHSERSFQVIDGDDDELLLVYRDAVTGLDAPIPDEWLKKTIRFGLKNDLRLVGDRIPVQPRQLGLSPWPADVKVAFHQE